MPQKDKRSLYRGHAALDRHGHLLWGTISRQAEEAQKKFDQWNPDATGQGMGEKIIQLEITLTK